MLIALPGVPRELFYLLEHAVLPWLAARFPAMGAIHARVLHGRLVGRGYIGDCAKRWFKFPIPNPLA